MTVTGFIQIRIIYQFDVPKTIMTNNAQPLKSAVLYKLYDKYQKKGNHSVRYYVPSNGLAEAFNRILCKSSGRWWKEQEKLGQISFSRPYGQIEPQSELRPRQLLIFGGEVVLPLKTAPSLKVDVRNKKWLKEKTNMRLAELETLDKDRVAVEQNLELYRQGMSHLTNAFGSGHFTRKGDLVLAIWTPMIIAKRRRKLEPN